MSKLIMALSEEELLPSPTPMSVEKAKEIVGCMVLWMMYHMEVTNDEPPKLTYSLRELIEANDIVKKANKDAEQTPFIDGKRSRTMSLVCDDRLIAALYTAAHYPGGPAENAQSIIECNGNVLFSIKKQQ
jgi:hypothetical protein